METLCWGVSHQEVEDLKEHWMKSTSGKHLKREQMPGNLILQVSSKVAEKETFQFLSAMSRVKYNSLNQDYMLR